MAKRLLLMRHAKSDWEADFSNDHDRPLSGRGVRSARLMGRFLKAHDLEPDHVISSTALRARRTAELAGEAAGWRADLVLDRALYDSGPDGVVDRARNAPDCARLMLVGHQPTWGLIARQLSGEQVEMKTATVAVIDFEVGSWGEIAPGEGVLIGVHHPRDHFGSRWDIDGTSV